LRLAQLKLAFATEQRSRVLHLVSGNLPQQCWSC